MRKYYLIIIIFLSLTSQLLSQSSFLDLYPLHIGNFWQYKITVYSGFNNEDTTYYVNREVIKDTLVSNGLIYKKVFDTRYGFFNPYNYLRVDSSTGCVYEYKWHLNEEYLIDSLGMMAGDTIFNGYGHMLECTLVDTIEFFGGDRLRKHFSLHVHPVFYRNKYAEGLGEIYRYDYFENIVAVEVISEITYAMINGEEFGQLVSVQKNTNEITSFYLSQNYPNPFNPTTEVRYSIPQTSKIVIKVFDILGNEIETLVNEEKHIGTYELTWNAEQLPSGIYFYRLQAGSFVETKKMVLMK